MKTRKDHSIQRNMVTEEGREWRMAQSLDEQAACCKDVISRVGTITVWSCNLGAVRLGPGLPDGPPPGGEGRKQHIHITDPQHRAPTRVCANLRRPSQTFRDASCRGVSPSSMYSNWNRPQPQGSPVGGAVCPMHHRGQTTRPRGTPTAPDVTGKPKRSSRATTTWATACSPRYLPEERRENSFYLMAIRLLNCHHWRLRGCCPMYIDMESLVTLIMET